MEYEENQSYLYCFVEDVQYFFDRKKENFDETIK